MQDENKMITVVGAPVFGTKMIFAAPVGEIDLYQSVQRRVKTKGAICRELFLEYCAILQGLQEMDVSFQVIKSLESMIVPGAYETLSSLVSLLDFPNLVSNAPSVVFPRDLAVCLEDRILLQADLQGKFRLPQSGMLGTKTVQFSPFGEGGMVMARKSTVCVVPEAYVKKKKGRVAVDPAVAFLGYAVSVFPNCVTYHNEEKYLKGYMREDHLDRIGGLLEGSDGKLHFVMSEQANANFHTAIRPPRAGSAVTAYREVCERAGIQLHVVPKLSIPASTCFYQALDGKVLMTCDDAPVARVVMDVVGSENTFFTKRPIECYPAWCQAGIRCLIGEIDQGLPKLIFEGQR